MEMANFSSDYHYFRWTNMVSYARNQEHLIRGKLIYASNGMVTGN
jgi:hypothetical protein